MKKFRKEYGITLVALVVTIIILLILAGIAIKTLTKTGNRFIMPSSSVKKQVMGSNS